MCGQKRAPYLKWGCSFFMGRSLKVLLAGVLLFHAGWYLILPFFAVLFTTRRGLTPAEAGTVLAVQSVLLLVGSTAGGVMSDRIGRKAVMLGGLVLRTAGIAMFAVSGGFWYYVLASAVAGLGGGLYAPAAKAGIAVLATEENKATVFSWRGIAANIGTSTGPLLGALLVRGPLPVLFGTAAAVHAVLGVATWTFLEGEPVGEQRTREPFGDLMTHLPFMLFALVTGLVWALFTQLSISVPLYASRVLGLEASIGLLFTLTSLTVILLQVPITRYVVARMQTNTAMALGTVLLGAGLGLVGFARTFPALVLAVLVFVVGEMFVIPTSDAAVTAMARPGVLGAYFGIATLAWGLGEAVGNLAGGSLMEYALGAGRPGLPWALYAGAGVVIGGLYLLLGRPHAVPGRVVTFDPGTPTPPAGIRLGPRQEEEE